MYATSDRQTDGRTDGQTDDGRRSPLNAPPTGREHNKDEYIWRSRMVQLWIQIHSHSAHLYCRLTLIRCCSRKALWWLYGESTVIVAAVFSRFCAFLAGGNDTQLNNSWLKALDFSGRLHDWLLVGYLRCTDVGRRPWIYLLLAAAFLLMSEWRQTEDWVVHVVQLSDYVTADDTTRRKYSLVSLFVLSVDRSEITLH